MELTATLTPFAQWLNAFFEGYDYAILDFLNTLAVNANGILTPIMKVISFLGEKGIIFYALAVVLALFPKTRKVAVCVFGAVCCGALITNIILKDFVARPRPYEFSTVFRSFWDTVGSPAESGYSFPSGHVTSAAAGMFALWFSKGRKFALPTIIWVALMMVSRNYLMVHFPSDVLASMLIGIFSAGVAWLITIAIFNFLEDNDDFPLCNFLLTFSLPIGSRSDDGVKEKVGGSVKAMKEKLASAPMPELPKAGKKGAKDSRDWNSRWDSYKKSKPAEDGDVKVFTGSPKKAPAAPAERSENAPAQPKPLPPVSARPAHPVQERPVSPVSAVKPKANDSFDELDEIKALLNSDTFFDSEPDSAPRRRSFYSEGGEYKGRH